MTDRREQIKTRGYFVGGARSERTQQLMEDFEWLLKDNERLLSIIEQHYLVVKSMEGVEDEKDATIATLRETLDKAIRWAEFTDEQIDELREAPAATEAP